MRYQHILFTLTFLGSTSLYANPVIETRDLSQKQAVQITPAAVDLGVAPVTNMNWQLLQKNQKLEDELRHLRGQIEELENSNQQLNHELNNRYTDLDQRLELLHTKLEHQAESKVEEETVAEVPIQPEEPTPVAVVDEAPVSPPPPPPVTANIQDNELDRAAYTIALEAYKNGGAKKAIDPMRNFIKNNPNSVYVSNAYFWMGEFYLAIEPVNYKRAKANYAEVVNAYPQSSKAATALFRLYSIAQNVDRDTKLAQQYQKQLRQNYPNSDEVKFIK
jgi:TolA-binding protein